MSQAPAYGPEQERKRARPGRGPAAEVAVSVRSIDSYSRCCTHCLPNAASLAAIRLEPCLGRLHWAAGRLRTAPAMKGEAAYP